MPTPFAVPIELTAEERAQLGAWGRRRSSAQAPALRSWTVLAAAEGAGNTEGARLGIAVGSVRKWRNRFAEQRLDGLTDEPRPGGPRTITDAMVEEVIVPHAGDDAQGRDALVDALAGQGTRTHAVGGAADLAGVRASTAPPGDVEALQGTHISSRRSETS